MQASNQHLQRSFLPSPFPLPTSIRLALIGTRSSSMAPSDLSTIINVFVETRSCNVTQIKDLCIRLDYIVNASKHPTSIFHLHISGFATSILQLRSDNHRIVDLSYTIHRGHHSHIVKVTSQHSRSRTVNQLHLPPLNITP